MTSLPKPGQPRIRELALTDRPIYRIERQGAIALSDAELIAVLCGLQDLGSAQRLLTKVDGLHGLYQSRPAELVGQVPGMGPVAAARLNAAFDLSRRLLSPAHQERPQIRSPADIAGILMLEMGGLDQEHLRVVLLNTKNVVQDIVTVSIGALNVAHLRIGELFRDALRRNSAAIILAHNHPSGRPDASPEDVVMTRQAVEAGNLLGVELLDHIIIGKGCYESMRSLGLGFID